eukprot:gb/GEZN01027145.1/.p1 GENE.gb/GEZN01027145.1/~~gb/GEZN01027145.1/.p1  ORF type:complete len:122 (+),score=3.44 gb/GEZN01027145.1/:29-394(+)
MAHVKALAGSAAGITVGIFLLILACVGPTKNWWPMMALIPYALMLLPILMCGASDPDGNMSLILTGNFFIGACLTSTFAIPLIMFHLGVIEVGSFLLAFFSSVTIFGSGGGYVWWSALHPE